MPQLLRLEWMKLRSYRTFWILLLLFGALLALFYTGVSSGVITLGNGNVNLLGKAYNFSAVWAALGFYASYFVIIIAILMTILVTNEYQYRTNRQHIIDGWTRLQFYHAKWQVLLALSLIVTVFTFLVGLINGISSGIPIGTAFQSIEKLLWLFLSCVDYLAFALLLSVLMKRSGLAIGILMAYSMIFENILHWIFLFKYQWPAGDFFLPLQCSDEMLPSSAAKMMNAALHSSFNPAPGHYALATICWITVFYIAGRWRILKGDW